MSEQPEKRMQPEITRVQTHTNDGSLMMFEVKVEETDLSRATADGEFSYKGKRYRITINEIDDNKTK